MGMRRPWVGRNCSVLDAAREPFAFVTITILSLLVPLSFLLLSRISGESYLQGFTASDHGFGRVDGDGLGFGWLLMSFFRSMNPFLVQALVSIISLAALFHGLTGKNIIQNEPESPWFGSRLYAAWIFLCTLQVCVGLGIECSIEAGSSSHRISLGNEIGMLSRVVFFLGLHETMVHWSRGVVKPVVDDTVFGGSMEERMAHKVSLAAGCGWLWWWRLRDEVETLVLVAEIKEQLDMNVGLADFVSWWLYYLIVTIGLARVIRSFIWVSMAFCCRSSLSSSFSYIEADEKV